MDLEEHYRKLERMYNAAPANAYYRPSIRVDRARAVVTVPVRSEFHHAAGAVHGALYFKALDDAAFFAVNSLLTDYFALTVSFTVYLTRPVVSGELVATGQVVSESKRLFIAEADLVDNDNRRVARGNGAFMKSAMALSREIGYE